MAVLAVLIPMLMLGVILMLGRYEELLLPLRGEGDTDRPEPAVASLSPAPATPSPSAAAPPPAGTPASSP
ncbi:hypothetical protein N4P33_15965 [Streptomyces sp. 15-116A]|uniref:hypothetical protein n=1 Tax=Streptomyces sp. 15-116A TaxID=2259035 RepID=UPI0021B2DF7B|nr:hypothetical protein [Streptomyces sp. 15-116A]MCT7353655.1 hypothetical protein [Streptomyces sp. 15-116A]